MYTLSGLYILFGPKCLHGGKFVVAQVGVCLVVELGEDGASHGIGGDVERHTPVIDVFACFCTLFAGVSPIR